jgi:hypothetical protein
LIARPPIDELSIVPSVDFLTNPESYSYLATDLKDFIKLQTEDSGKFEAFSSPSTYLSYVQNKGHALASFLPKDPVSGEQINLDLLANSLGYDAFAWMQWISDTSPNRETYLFEDEAIELGQKYPTEYPGDKSIVPKNVINDLKFDQYFTDWQQSNSIFLLDSAGNQIPVKQLLPVKASLIDPSLPQSSFDNSISK